MEGIGLSVNTFNLEGAMYLRDKELDPAQELRNQVRDRRVSRTATLDGGVSVYDTGYAVADRSITVRIPNPTQEIVAFFAYLVETYSMINVTTGEAAFEGTPMRYFKDDQGGATLVVGIKNKLS